MVREVDDQGGGVKSFEFSVFNMVAVWRILIFKEGHVMGLVLSLASHIMGTIVAAIFVYFIAPYFSEYIEADVEFVYLVLYALLAIWSVREGRKIEKGKHEIANDLEKIVSPEDGK